MSVHPHLRLPLNAVVITSFQRQWSPVIVKAMENNEALKEEVKEMIE